MAVELATQRSYHQLPPTHSKPTFYPGIISTLTSDEKCRYVEQKVANTLSELPYVLNVLQSKQNSTDDANMIDLRVFIHPEEGVKENEIKVQVKSSRWGIEDFERRLRNFGYNSRRAQELWRIRNNFVLINGGRVLEEPAHIVREVTPEEIIVDFSNQLHRIKHHRGGNVFKAPRFNN